MPNYNFFSDTLREQSLYNNNIDEFIDKFGVEVVYFRKQDFNPDQFFGEDPSAVYDYNEAYTMRMYMENPNDFDGADEMFTKFGLQLDNNASLFVQQDKIHAMIGGIPLPDDVIYIPMMNRLFQVVKPEEKSTFFLFGKLMSYKIFVKTLEYSMEQFDVDILEVDNMNGKTSIDTSLDDNTTVGQISDIIDFNEDNPFNDF